jgi:putative ATP-dependent endonuclease of the OLD family
VQCPGATTRSCTRGEIANGRLDSGLHGVAREVIAAKDDVDRLAAPDFEWLLFEEPEAFLHPTQADALDRGLRRYSVSATHQVLVTTHSTRFASRNMTDLPALVRLERVGGMTAAGQISNDKLLEVLASNQTIANEIRSATEAVGLGDVELQMESIKYAL